MIRPVSLQQLQSPRKPRIDALLSPSSPLKSSATTILKSPIKKHLQHASAIASETSSVGATAPSIEELDRVPSSRHGPLKAKLRASVLQSVLRLLDQDVNALAGAQEILQAAAALPLTEPHVQRACVQALRELHESNTTSMPPSFVYDAGSFSTANWDSPVPPPSPRKQVVQQTRSSGRPKSVTASSLHHCKEFLLACANEIHELEDDHPMKFDYAEDTTSTSNRSVSSEKPCKHCGAANFDYASTVQESLDASVESDCCSEDNDDTRADQGSQFSEVLHRAEYMSEMDEDEEIESSNHKLSMNDRVVCRRVLRALHQQVQSQRRRSTAPNLALKFRVFEALKLQASLNRKRLAFQQLKTGLRSRHQQSPSVSTTVVKPRIAIPMNSTFQTLMVHHSDVLLLLLALVFLANLPAKYIM